MKEFPFVELYGKSSFPSLDELFNKIKLFTSKIFLKNESFSPIRNHLIEIHISIQHLEC